MARLTSRRRFARDVEALVLKRSAAGAAADPDDAAVEVIAAEWTRIFGGCVEFVTPPQP